MIDLLKADLRMTVYNRWWVLIGVFLLFFLLSVSHQGGFEGYLTWTYLFAPLAFLPFSSLSVAKERESEFLNAVFTTPVSKGEYTLEKFLLWFIMGCIYLIVTLPVTLAHYHFVDEIYTITMLKFILTSVLLMAFLSGLGVTISVICIKESKIALIISIATALIFYVAYIGFPSEAYFFALNHVPLYIMHFSPLVLAGDYLDLWWFSQPLIKTHVIHAMPSLSAISLLLLSLFLPLVAYVIFRYSQNVEGYEMKKIFPILIIALVFIFPLTGVLGYERGESLRTGTDGGGSYDMDFGWKNRLLYSEEINARGAFYFKSYVEELHNVTIRFTSEDSSVKFDPFVMEFSSLPVYGETYEFDITIDPLVINGAVTSQHPYSVTFVSDEGSWWLRSFLTIENDFANTAVNSTSLLSFALFAVLPLLFRKKMKLSI